MTQIRRRQLLQMAAGAAGVTLAAAPRSFAQRPPKLVIGYSPIAAGIPFYLAVERGFFKQLGLDVEAVRFANPQQIIEGMIAGRVQGSANGVASGSLAIADAASSGLFKIICSNPSNARFQLDEVLVPANSPVKSLRELAGKRVICGLGPQNVAIAKGILQANGVTNARVTSVAIDQHVQILQAGQADAAYTLEPTGTVGRLAKATRVLEYGVVAKYILGDANAPWFGGSAALVTSLIKNNPLVARQYISAYRRAVNEVRNNPTTVRQHLDGYTAISPQLTREVPLPGYKMYDEITPGDMRYFQRFFDFLQKQGVLSRPVAASSLVLRGTDFGR